MKESSRCTNGGLGLWGERSPPRTIKGDACIRVQRSIMQLIKSNHGVVILALMASLVSDVVAAPVGTAFTYQGRLRSAGQPANGNYDLKFTLYDAVSGSGQVGSPVTNAPVIVTNGNFTVSLDFGAVFSGDARWLEIGVRTNGSSSPYSTPSTRQPLTPTPYALYAPAPGWRRRRQRRAPPQPCWQS